MNPKFRLAVNGNGEYRIESCLYRFVGDVWDAGDGFNNRYKELSMARAVLEKVRRECTWIPVEEVE